MNLGVILSYKPMFLDISKLFYGNPKEVFKYDEDGHELHVDRLLNVIGSGFFHGKFFSKALGFIKDMFDNADFHNQPSYIADMGCGDGTFLKTVFEFIITFAFKSKTLVSWIYRAQTKTFYSFVFKLAITFALLIIM